MVGQDLVVVGGLDGFGEAGCSLAFEAWQLGVDGELVVGPLGGHPEPHQAFHGAAQGRVLADVVGYAPN